MKTTLTLLCAVLSFSMSLNAQLTQINSNKSLRPDIPFDNGKTFLISELDSTVWVTDGTLAGTIQLSSTIKHVETGGIINNKIVFVGVTDAVGIEVFVSDGTVAGTTLLKDVYTGVESSRPDDLFALLNGFLYFTADRPAEGRELWRTDGTPAGTNVFKDIVPGAVSAFAPDSSNLFSSGSYLLLVAKTASEGSELWTSNGTVAGTVLLSNINPGSASSFPDYFSKLNNIVIFQATDAVAGREYWKTDGTSAGTNRIKDINPGTADVNSTFTFPFIYIFNNKAFFIANDGVHDEEPWYTDGTEANTGLLKDIHTGSFSLTALANAVKVGSKFFFTSTDFTDKHELWVSDGTPAGTTLFKSFEPANSSGTPFIFTPFLADFIEQTYTQPLFQGNKFFFSAGTEAEGSELWVSDGTIDGTKMVKNIGPNDDDGVFYGTYAYTTSFFYFAADDGVNGIELWRSDGSAPNTTMVMDINPNGDSEPEIHSIVTGGYVLVTANNGDGPFGDLYALQGVTPLPVNLTTFTVVADAGNAVLRWSTAQETNSADFQVQRSYDGRTFTNIGLVAASGNSNDKRYYSYVDASRLSTNAPTVYYRLNQRNRNGDGTLTKVIWLHTIDRYQFNVRLLQNPVAASTLSVSLQSRSSKVYLSIKDMAGRMMATAIATTGNGFVNIDISTLPKGMFVLIATEGDNRKVISFVKQ